MTLFLSYAHPDDECFFTAGVARRCADAGMPVVLCCATRGQAGSAGNPPLASREELPAVREAELREAAAMLGISELHFLPYEDRKLAEAPPDEIRASLVGLLRRHRPWIVVTFEPNGGNLHPDHVAISRFTGDAVAATADPRWHPSWGPRTGCPACSG